MAKSKSSSSLVSVLYAIAFAREACVLLMSVIFIRSAGEYELNSYDVLNLNFDFYIILCRRQILIIK